MPLSGCVISTPETNPTGATLVVAPLACSLFGAEGVVRFVPGTRLAALYGVAASVQRFYCNYGVAPDFRAALAAGALRVAAEDERGDVRAVELAGHPYFLGTLFQPELSTALGAPPPPVVGLVAAAAARQGGALR